mgnify:FL=1
MIPNKEQAFELLKMKLLYASMSRSAPSRQASRPCCTTVTRCSAAVR